MSQGYARHIIKHKCRDGRTRRIVPVYFHETVAGTGQRRFVKRAGFCEHCGYTNFSAATPSTLETRRVPGWVAKQRHGSRQEYEPPNSCLRGHFRFRLQEYNPEGDFEENLRAHFCPLCGKSIICPKCQEVVFGCRCESDDEEPG